MELGDLQVYSLLNKKIKGVATGISSIEADDSNHTLVFHLTDGTTISVSVPVAHDGASITGVHVNEDDHLIVTITAYDGTVQQVDAGELPVLTIDDMIYVGDDEPTEENIRLWVDTSEAGETIPTIIDGWSSGVTYRKDQIVYYEGALYRALQNNQSETFDETDWEKMEMAPTLVYEDEDIDFSSL